METEGVVARVRWLFVFTNIIDQDVADIQRPRLEEVRLRRVNAPCANVAFSSVSGRRALHSQCTRCKPSEPLS